jgi:hypothetical protein
MGGRGAPSPFSRRRSLWIDTSRQGYSAVTSEDRPTGVTYQFFDQIAAAGEANQAKGYFDKTLEERPWSVISTDPNSAVVVERHRDHTFGMKEPTLMWFKDGQRKELYIEGVTTEQYLERSGLSFSYKRGEEAKLFKRMSRIMRSYSVEQRFDRSEVKIERVSDERYGKVHDGAGVVSREMLGKFLINSQLSPRKQQVMAEELNHAGRIEFTIMTKRGQEKGHAIVSDPPLLNQAGEKVDFILPSDIKGEVKLTEPESTWVGINFVHGKGKMKMDVQSLANFGPKAGSDQAFISPEQHAGFIRDEVARFEQAVQAGTDPTIDIKKSDAFATPEEIAASPHQEFALSGGDIRHYPTHIARVIDQKIESMEFTRDIDNKRKLQLPVPGARLYMMPDHVGQVAGLDISIPRGEVYMDLERGTAWVNSEDWLQVQDSPESNPHGLRDIWGGADNDDALWMIPFRDQAEGVKAEEGDSGLKVVAWRSPNEDGEYVILRPTANSDLPKWEKANGEWISHIEANSDYLPTRVDHAQRTYQGMVTEPSGGERVNGFDLADMEAAARRGSENAGALGGYINPTIVYRAANGELPNDLPASTEEIIDAMNKNGGDLTGVKRYSYELSARMVTSGVPIPPYLADRLLFDPNLDKGERAILSNQIRYTDGSHHIDRVTQAVRDEIDHLHRLKEKMVGEAHPPNKLYDTVFNEPDAEKYFTLGADLNKTFSHTLYRVIRPEQIKAHKARKALAVVEQGLKDGDPIGLNSDAIKIQAYLSGQISKDEIKEAEFKTSGVLQALTGRLTKKEIGSFKFSPQDFDRAKWSVWEKLSHYPPTEKGKILRAGLADDLMAGKGGKSMWRYAVRDEVGGIVYHDLRPEVAHELQKTGLGNAMNQALREVGLLNYHTDGDKDRSGDRDRDKDRNRDRDRELHPQANSQVSHGINNNGSNRNEPNSYRPIQFSGLAQQPEKGEVFLSISQSHPSKKTGAGAGAGERLIAKTADGRLFGEVKSGELQAGDRIQLKYNKPSSTGTADLFGVFEKL